MKKISRTSALLMLSAAVMFACGMLFSCSTEEQEEEAAEDVYVPEPDDPDGQEYDDTTEDSEDDESEEPDNEEPDDDENGNEEGDDEDEDIDNGNDDDWGDTDDGGDSGASLLVDEMPIIGWRGIPKDALTYRNFTTMKEGGFNTTLSMFTAESQLAFALELGEQTGIHVIARWPGGFYDEPETYVPKYDDSPALMGYFVVDEPSTSTLSDAAEKMQAIRDAGATKLCYVNLNPYTSGTKKNYESYVQSCIDALKPEVISFDHYPIRESNGKITIRDTWLDNLQIIRDAALAEGVPFWAFALSCPHLSYPEPTLEHLRLQVNVNLAYGAQAIQYYTYWLPQGDGGDDDYTLGYYNAPIDWDGNPTETYYKVQQVNKEIIEVAPLFYKGTITDVQQVSKSYEGAEFTAPDGAVGSLLTSPSGTNYLVLVNMSLENDMEATYKSSSHTIHPGGMLVLPK